MTAKVERIDYPELSSLGQRILISRVEDSSFRAEVVGSEGKLNIMRGFHSYESAKWWGLQIAEARASLVVPTSLATASPGSKGKDPRLMYD